MDGEVTRGDDAGACHTPIVMLGLDLRGITRDHLELRAAEDLHAQLVHDFQEKAFQETRVREPFRALGGGNTIEDEMPTGVRRVHDALL